VNGGKTWSSWYNQPTAQFYHVITDDRFPYRVFGGQQESGSAEVLSRGNDGAISFRDFHPVGVEEYGYVAPDPLHPWLIYGGKATVYDERTGQTQDVSPTYDRKKYRFDRTDPLIWNRVDKHVLYLGLNVVFATRDGGKTWTQISPDLTRADPGEPATLAKFASVDPLNGKHRGVVYSLSPSYIDKDLIWAGTDDGLLWVTRDAGAHWRNVTPPALGPWSRVTQIDASHFDRATAYISVSRQRLDDLHPYVYRTHDGGTSWQAVTTGIPANEPVNTVREDPRRGGLLFAGTERTVYVSFDDGARWQSLQSNLPPTSIRDLVVHGDDLVVGTHGRSFWILDDIEPLREHGDALAAAPVHLFAPAPAYRIHRDTYTDTPLPPDEPVGQNPPDGAIFDYTLSEAARGPVTIAIYAAKGRLVRTQSSSDPPDAIDPDIDVPLYWVRPTRLPATGAGHHRFVWDMHEAAPLSLEHYYPISAIVHDTPRAPEGVFVPPGRYEVRLSVDGKTYAQPLTILPDPRVTVPVATLRDQYALALRMVDGMNRAYTQYQAAKARKDNAAAGRYARLNASLGRLLEIVDGVDAAPTREARATVDDLLKGLTARGQTRVDLRDVDEP